MKASKDNNAKTEVESKEPGPRNYKYYLIGAVIIICSVATFYNLRSRINSLKGEVAMYVEKEGKMKADTEKLKKDLEGFNRDIEELKKDLENKDEKNIELSTEKETLEKQLDDLLTEKKKIELELKKERDRAKSASRGGSRGVSKDLRTRSGLTAEQFNKAFAGTNMSGLGETIINAEEEYGVNGLFLSSIAALESGWGSSYAARNRNNLTGYGGGKTYFNSKSGCLMRTAKLLGENYLNPSGKYYSKKYGATLKGVNVLYCTGDAWQHKVASQMDYIIKKTR